MRRFPFNKTIGVIGLAVYAATPGPALAEPQTTESTSYYEIAGRTTTDLLAQMKRVGPVDQGEGNTRYFARTDWHVDWHYAYKRQPGLCAVGTISVKLSVQYLYPRWTDESRADPAAQKAWETFMVGLQTHEPGHARNGLDAAREVERALATVGEQQSCSKLGAAANELAHSIIQKHQAMDVEYDRTTGHGRTQGAVLKPSP